MYKKEMQFKLLNDRSSELVVLREAFRTSLFRDSHPHPHHSHWTRRHTCGMEQMCTEEGNNGFWTWWGWWRRWRWREYTDSTPATLGMGTWLNHQWSSLFHCQTMLETHSVALHYLIRALPHWRLPHRTCQCVFVCVCECMYVCVCVRVCGNGSHLTRTTWQCKCRGTTVVVKARLIVVKRITSQSNCVHICVRVCVCVCVCVCTSRE